MFALRLVVYYALLAGCLLRMFGLTCFALFCVLLGLWVTVVVCLGCCLLVVLFVCI